MDHGADVKARASDGHTALDHAETLGPGLAELLIDHGAEFGGREEPEVYDDHEPEEDHDTQMAKEAQLWQELLAEGLTEAVNTGNLDKVKESLELGASPERSDLLHYAVTTGNLGMVDLLLESGCPPDATAVEIALKNNRYDMIGLLTAKGANIDVITSNGRTAP